MTIAINGLLSKVALPSQVLVIVLSGTISVIGCLNYPISPDEDLDGNGLPDSWEIDYFGYSGVNPAADVSGDGLSNIDKFMFGLSPLVDHMYTGAFARIFNYDAIDRLREITGGPFPETIELDPETNITSK